MSIIIKPIISEKATYLTDLRGQYSFLVDTKANKIQIKNENFKQVKLSMFLQINN